MPLALAVFGQACGGQGANPFADGSVLARPRATAAIVYVSDAYAARPGAPHELFAIDEDGTGMTRLTLCNGEGRQCDNLEVAPAFDGRRLASRRVLTDSDGNGRLGIGDTETLMISDLQRGVEGSLTLRVASLAGTTFLTNDRLSGLDWSPQADILVYSSIGEGGTDDLFRTVPRPDTDGSQTRNLTISGAVRERRPRVDPTGNVAAYERSQGGAKAQIWIFQTTTTQIQVTAGGDGVGVLGDLAVGSDTDPDYSPDGNSLVFRRLTGNGNAGLGTWDLMIVRLDGTGLTTLVTGPAYRSAPDWGPKGIVYSEIDRASGLAQLVVIQPDATARRVLMTLNGFDIQSPRWLPKP